MIKEKYSWVKRQLTLYPKLRDSNERLFYNYLLDIGYDTNRTVKDFLKDMETRKIPYLDSFGRASRKVQEEHPSLRGELWTKKKTKKEQQVRQEIRDLS